MRNFSKAAALGALLLTLLLPTAASAQDYPGGNAGNAGSQDSGGAGSADDGGEVLPTDATKGDDVLGSGGVNAGAGATAETGTGGAATAPSGSLPITGGDVVGLTVIGAAAIGLGAVFVRRSRRTAPTTA